jgi:NadR type nicotinamide-nucleotide adenylyltransferase
MIRVVLTGSESTGKTTLAAELARHYDAALVPEFVRAFAEAKGGLIEFSDHGPIARGQMALEDAQLALGKPVVVQDTDLLSTVVYCKHYFGRAPDWIVDEAAARVPDLYLLCEIDLPWIADGVRDRGHMREEMQQLFRDAVMNSGAAVAIIRGDGHERLERAVEAIDALLLAQSPNAAAEENSDS